MIAVLGLFLSVVGTEILMINSPSSWRSLDSKFNSLAVSFGSFLSMSNFGRETDLGLSFLFLMDKCLTFVQIEVAAKEAWCSWALFGILTRMTRELVILWSKGFPKSKGTSGLAKQREVRSLFKTGTAPSQLYSDIVDKKVRVPQAFWASGVKLVVLPVLLKCRKQCCVPFLE